MLKKLFQIRKFLLVFVILALVVSIFQNHQVTAEEKSNEHSRIQLSDISISVREHAKSLSKTVVGESLELRTENSKHYKLSDGSYIAEISSIPEHFMDQNGVWQNINTELIDEADVDFFVKPISIESAKEIEHIALNNKEARRTTKIDRTRTAYRALQVPFDVKLPKDISDGYSIGQGEDSS